MTDNVTPIVAQAGQVARLTHEREAEIRHRVEYLGPGFERLYLGDLLAEVDALRAQHAEDRRMLRLAVHAQRDRAEQAERERDATRADLQQARAENERLREVLAFYANIREYNRVAGDPAGSYPPIVWESGARARDALAATSEPAGAAAACWGCDCSGAPTATHGCNQGDPVCRHNDDGPPAAEPDPNDLDGPIAGGMMPRAFVEALVLGVMSPPEPADLQDDGSSDV